MDARDVIAGKLPTAYNLEWAQEIVDALHAANIDLVHRDENHGPTRAFALGDRVTKTKGSSWTGHVVGFYSTDLTPVGYCIESENEPGSVQIYPEAAIRAMGEKK